MYIRERERESKTFHLPLITWKRIIEWDSKVDFHQKDMRMNKIIYIYQLIIKLINALFAHLTISTAFDERLKLRF